jgi:hypothetical protein
MCSGFPQLGVLRRLRPASDRSADGGPNPDTELDAQYEVRTETVPVFTR